MKTSSRKRSLVLVLGTLLVVGIVALMVVSQSPNPVNAGTVEDTPAAAQTDGTLSGESDCYCALPQNDAQE